MFSPSMTALVCTRFGAPDVLAPTLLPVPELKPHEVLIRVEASGVNRADILQRQGKYPPPEGASDILGLEVAGSVVAVGAETKRWKGGDKICALLAGGGYAEYVAVDAAHCLPIPPHLSWIEAAALPEAIVTVYALLYEEAGLRDGETVLIHGGAGGIGTTAIQMLKTRGVRVFVTVRSPEKAAACLALGAEAAILSHQEDFVARVNDLTAGEGVNVVLDNSGGDYLNRNLACLAPRGRHISLATMRGKEALIDLRLVMQKRLMLTGSTLRACRAAEKARLIAAVEAEVWPLVATGKIKPVIDQSFDIKNAAAAHKRMESSAHIGKMVLIVSLSEA